jgi:formylglycine-generating enzyme required for sulfatase activity/HEAT repeat protein
MPDLPIAPLLVTLSTTWLIATTPPGLAQPAPTPTPSPTVSPSPVSPSPTASPSPASNPTTPPEPPLEQISKALQQQQIPLAILGVLFLSYQGILWLKPQWLLKIPSSDLAIPGTKFKIPLSLVKPLKYRDRALDSWVQQHWQGAEASFFQLPTATARQIHIPLPVCIGQSPNLTLINELSGEHLQPIFAKKNAVLGIVGEGGAGKTSLACQIAHWGLNQQLAKHRLLPVLIETELDEKKSLLEAIRGQLNSLTNQPEPIALELVEFLLLRQRILVIVDHLSEMSDTTRKQITPEIATFPAKALVVTTRLEDSFITVPNTTLLKPQRIEGSRLSRFMDTYLEQRHQRHLFEDEDFFDACRRLSGMVGQRNITVLLARLYADQLIEQQTGAGGILPASIPELMLSYLNQLNRTIEPANQRDNLQVHQDAQAIAWECLKQTYRPTSAKQTAALAALSHTLENPDPKDSPKHRLQYLEQRLRLLQTLEPGDKLRIILDPLAEYLAALWFVDSQLQHTDRAQPETIWQQFFTDIDTKLRPTHETPEAIQGFLLAVHDCCQLRQAESPEPLPFPPTLLPDLICKAGLDPEVLQRAQENRRTRLLISELSAPEVEYRLRAATDLGNRGAAAAIATPNLFALLENLAQPLNARQTATIALGKIGRTIAPDSPPHTEIGDRLLFLLNDSSLDQTLRRTIATALGTMNAGATTLRQILADPNQPLPLRQGAATALRQLPVASGEPIPMLIVCLQAGQTSTQVKSIPVFKESLEADLTLDVVEIPGGEFVMGSPPAEAGRDYKNIFNELIDVEVDLETQHRVTVPSFYCGQYPITQAQWRFVSGLPQVQRSLDPDPANFKGRDRPVECVSWYDAVEFCDRLSQHTGKPYRLPSEAEWEYACRTGTNTPFHHGDTLSTNLANYDGNYTYGSGLKGTYHNKTIDVGSFGVVNAFGLADLHGTVWEWCLDHWHPSYENAPTDGSAWVTDGDDRYRLLRGGSWYNNPDNCRSAMRYRNSPALRSYYYGFRVVCVAPWTS